MNLLKWIAYQIESPRARLHREHAAHRRQTIAFHTATRRRRELTEEREAG